MIQIFKKHPKEIVDFIDAFTDLIRNKNFDTLKGLFLTESTLTHDYTKLGGDKSESNFKEFMESLKDGLMNYTELEMSNKIKSVKNSQDMITVVLKCEDKFKSNISSLTYMKYDQEMHLKRIDKKIKISRVICYYKKLKT